MMAPGVIDQRRNRVAWRDAITHKLAKTRHERQSIRSLSTTRDGQLQGQTLPRAGLQSLLVSTIDR